VENLSLQGNINKIKTASQPQGQSFTATMFAAPVTEKGMEKVILSLNKTSSGGCDDIPMWVVKLCMICCKPVSPYM